MKAIIKLLRPHQWIKNIIIVLPAFFGGAAITSGLILNLGITVVAYCLIASGIYVLNDLLDAQEDRKHPTKQFRPIAHGDVSKTTALILIALLWSIGLGLVLLFIPSAATWPIFTTLSIYIAINIFYSRWGKHIVILDVLFVTFGYLLRMFAGGFAAHIEISEWLMLTIFFLTLMLGIGKRKEDVLLHIKTGQVTRKVAKEYTDEFLNLALGITGAVVIIIYALYTVDPIVKEMHGKYLYITVPVVTWGILHYIHRIVVAKENFNPTDFVLKDRRLLLILISWVVLFILSGYVRI